MRARSPVYLLAFDACDPSTAQMFAKSGHLPSFRRMFERSARCRVRNPMGLFVGGVWISFATGLRSDRHGFHCWDEIDVASYERQLTRPGTDYVTFWQRLSESGRRVAVIDVPHAIAAKPVNDIQIAEWGCHDRHFGFCTWPNGLASDIESSFGLHPIFGIDAYADKQFAPDDYAHRAGPARTTDEDRALLEGLDRGLSAKRRLATELFANESWDLFLAVFGENHGIGHQQWPYHDAAHPLFDRVAVEELGGDPILHIYQNLDAALGELPSRTDACLPTRWTRSAPNSPRTCCLW
jgi:predicted AlkP superfamily phosphohydrolase/phosphomutase